MKGALAFSILFISLVGSTYAQMDWGVKGGLNLAKFHVSATVPGFGSVSNSTDNITSFHAGVYMRAFLSKMVSIQPELMYSGQGGSSSTGEAKFEYINVPVMFQYNANKRFNIHAGPQIGFVVAATSGGQSIMNDLNTIDVALGFGFGFEFGRGVSLGFRYNLGLTNITKIDLSGAPAGTSVTTTNEVIQIGLSYRLSHPSSE